MNFIRGLFMRFQRPAPLSDSVVEHLRNRLAAVEKILRTDEANADLVQSNRALTQSFAELEARAAAAEATNATLRRAYQDCKDARARDAAAERDNTEVCRLLDEVIAPRGKRVMSTAELHARIRTVRIKL